MKAKARRVDYYPDEYIAGVGGALDAVEQGVYWMICSLIMSEGGAIEQNDRRLAGLCRMRPADIRRTVERLLERGKIHRGDDGKLFQKRAQSEVEKSLNRIQTAIENGSNGGRPAKKGKRFQQKHEPNGSFSAEANHQPPTTNLSEDDFAKAQSSTRRSSKTKPATESAKSIDAPVGSGNGSAEDRFWSMAAEMEAKGIGRTVLGKLATLYGGDFTSAIGALESARLAKVPRAYLGKVINNLEKANGPAGTGGIPAWVLEARAAGYPVDREDGRWRFCGGLYDDQKQQVGM
ncbi:DUF1376 domain-containing protein [Mesorhizobium sp. IMUNJ 23232]|uniref:DUF1376 domain-containing protein n=1 Tax=Mesorhizobium sp. IMUNJ 23232 TaxID=3376064 RepID=UPI0037AE69C4